MSIESAHLTAVTEPDHILLQARDVEFDWTDLPMHWIPGDPFTTHVFNVLHLLLPAGRTGSSRRSRKRCR
ncbi:putative metal-dependent hydrolase family protein [Rhodococcus sp. MTM3W5.2]|nr:putative metal-dependent hydrolase family protein [Rhodococcus sp. MTM3W5.2]